jgi:cytochrome P450
MKNWADSAATTITESWFPFLLQYIPVIPEAYDKLWKISDDIMKSREAQKISAKNDFIARLMELKRDVKQDPGAEHHLGLNDDVITAQGVIFFVAGFETTSATLTSLCYQLALNPDVQERKSKNSGTYFHLM